MLKSVKTTDVNCLPLAQEFPLAIFITSLASASSCASKGFAVALTGQVGLQYAEFLKVSLTMVEQRVPGLQEGNCTRLPRCFTS
jgi:hypothetical protein